MKWSVTIRPAAKADLQRAHDWYEEKYSGLGDEFLADMAESFLRLENNPERFPIYYRNFRRVLAHNIIRANYIAEFVFPKAFLPSSFC